jgi:hypothetical protein
MKYAPRDVLHPGRREGCTWWDSRLPGVDRAQKRFNTGIVVMIEHDKTPSRELLERANGISAAWIDYFYTTTGHRATMTATPR